MTDAVDTAEVYGGRPSAHLISVQEVAKALSVTGRTVLRMIERGDLEAVRVGRQWRVDSGSFRQYLASGIRSAP